MLDLDDEKAYLGMSDRKLDVVLMAASAVHLMDDDVQRFGRHSGTPWRASCASTRS